MYNLPNFIIVGAARSGTTSIFHYLKQHPDVYIPSKKECRYFSQMKGDFKGPEDDEIVNTTLTKTLSDYRLLFQQKSNERAVGDVSPDYLYHYEKSVYNILNLLGKEVKIIIMLRNPVERTFSHYLHYVKSGREFLSFEDALENENKRMKNNWEWGWFYKDVSFYYKQVKAYFNAFNNIKIYLFDDLIKNRSDFLKDIFNFLGVDPNFKPDLNTVYNVSGVAKNKLFHAMVFKPNVLKAVIKGLTKPFLTEEEFRKYIAKIRTKSSREEPISLNSREYLKELFRENISKLHVLIKRDLNHWLS